MPAAWKHFPPTPGLINLSGRSRAGYHKIPLHLPGKYRLKLKAHEIFFYNWQCFGVAALLMMQNKARCQKLHPGTSTSKI